MQAFEYKLVSAPRRGAKVKGARTPEARFAAAVEAEVNRLAAEGWEYVRSDTLPCEERQGWFSGRTTVSRTLLVFRRATASEPGLSTPAASPAMAAPTAAPPATHLAEPPLSAPPFASAPSVGNHPMPGLGDGGPVSAQPIHDPVPSVRIRPELPASRALPPQGGTPPASFAAPRRAGAPSIGQAPQAPSPSAAATRTALEDLLSRREPPRPAPPLAPPLASPPRPAREVGTEGGDPA